MWIAFSKETTFDGCLPHDISKSLGPRDGNLPFLHNLLGVILFLHLLAMTRNQHGRHGRKMMQPQKFFASVLPQAQHHRRKLIHKNNRMLLNNNHHFRRILDGQRRTMFGFLNERSCLVQPNVERKSNSVAVYSQIVCETENAYHSGTNSSNCQEDRKLHVNVLIVGDYVSTVSGYNLSKSIQQGYIYMPFSMLKKS